MRIDTTRFGPIEADESRIITFAEGILGFPQHRRYALVQTGDSALYWLQSVEDPGLAFVVCDPTLFVPDYQAPIRADDLAALGIEDVSQGQVLVIVNKVDGYLTANLLGPLVIGTGSLAAKQLVLSDKRYSTRHRLVRLPVSPAVARSA